jgi:probable phosphoglycerate mutase
MGELEGEVGRSNKPAPSLETTPNFAARCLAWYARSIVNYMMSTLQAGLPTEQPHNILIVSHGAWIAVVLSALRTHRMVVCPRGVEIGGCLNTGVSIVEYVGVRDGVWPIGTLVQYSGVEHLMHERLHRQEVNADVLEERGRRQ